MKKKKLQSRNPSIGGCGESGGIPGSISEAGGELICKDSFECEEGSDSFEEIDQYHSRSTLEHQVCSKLYKQTSSLHSDGDEFPKENLDDEEKNDISASFTPYEGYGTTGKTQKSGRVLLNEPQLSSPRLEEESGRYGDNERTSRAGQYNVNVESDPKTGSFSQSALLAKTLQYANFARPEMFATSLTFSDIDQPDSIRSEFGSCPITNPHLGLMSQMLSVCGRKDGSVITSLNTHSPQHTFGNSSLSCYPTFMACSSDTSNYSSDVNNPDKVSSTDCSVCENSTGRDLKWPPGIHNFQPNSVQKPCFNSANETVCTESPQGFRSLSQHAPQSSTADCAQDGSSLGAAEGSLQVYGLFGSTFHPEGNLELNSELCNAPHPELGFHFPSVQTVPNLTQTEVDINGVTSASDFDDACTINRPVNQEHNSLPHLMSPLSGFRNHPPMLGHPSLGIGTIPQTTCSYLPDPTCSLQFQPNPSSSFFAYASNPEIYAPSFSRPSKTAMDPVGFPFSPIPNQTYLSGMDKQVTSNVTYGSYSCINPCITDRLRPPEENSVHLSKSNTGYRTDGSTFTETLEANDTSYSLTHQHSPSCADNMVPSFGAANNVAVLQCYPHNHFSTNSLPLTASQDVIEAPTRERVVQSSFMSSSPNMALHLLNKPDSVDLIS